MVDASLISNEGWVTQGQAKSIVLALLNQEIMEKYPFIEVEMPEPKTITYTETVDDEVIEKTVEIPQEPKLSKDSLKSFKKHQASSISRGKIIEQLSRDDTTGKQAVQMYIEHNRKK